MSRAELLAVIDKLRAEHGQEFQAWYDCASYPAIEDYCEVGWLLSRYYRSQLLEAARAEAQMVQDCIGRSGPYMNEID